MISISYQRVSVGGSFARLLHRCCATTSPSGSHGVRGEPIVCTPQDAFRCFMGSDIELLVIGNFLRQKGIKIHSLPRLQGLIRARLMRRGHARVATGWRPARSLLLAASVIVQAAYIAIQGISGKWNRDCPEKTIEITVKYVTRTYPVAAYGESA